MSHYRCDDCAHSFESAEARCPLCLRMHLVFPRNATFRRLAARLGSRHARELPPA